MKKEFFKKIVREPLLQFLLLGVALFFLDAYFSLDREDPKNIIVNDARVAELRQIFMEGQGRAPSTKELEAMIITWTQNEIFYREGIALGLNKGDDMIRNRVILKMRNVLFNNTIVEPPSEQQQQEYFELNRSAYQQPERFDFELVMLTGIDSREQAARRAQQINAEPSQLKENAVYRYDARPLSNIQTLFPKTPTDELVNADDNTWVAVESTRGWHLLRITQRYEAVSRSFEQARSQVARDWKKLSNDYQLAQQSTEIANKYRLHLELSEPLDGPLDWRPDNMAGPAEAALGQAGLTDRASSALQ